MVTNVLTLLELNTLLSDVVEQCMPDAYWVEAELAECRVNRGHCYMDLSQTDERTRTPIARARAICWANTWAALRPYFERVTGQTLHAGMKVMLCVEARFHPTYGFSWIVTDINPEYTLGDMARRRQQIINQLKEEGVFDLQKALSLPLFAQRIAVVSSATAAGYGDFCNQLADNSYGLAFHSELFEAVMQGEQVEASIIDALDSIFERLDDFDAVVIIRGGGATADMSGFDTLQLAESVANFPLPIITGIGHERDESILDMVSFQRVKTPTAAAALLIDHLAITLQCINEAGERVSKAVMLRMERERHRLEKASARIPMLFSLIKVHRQAQIDKLYSRLAQQAAMAVERQKRRLLTLRQFLPTHVKRILSDEHHKLNLTGERLKVLDPALLLKRGYSITLHNGKAVRNAAALRPGDEITTRVEKGRIKSIVLNN